MSFFLKFPSFSVCSYILQEGQSAAEVVKAFNDFVDEKTG